MASARDTASGLLSRICDGEAGASAQLFPLVYDQLRSIASSLLGQERADHTLQPTALVHEAYLRLVNFEALKDADDGDARRHFLAISACAMRRILVEHARSRGRDKRGGGWHRVTFDESLQGSDRGNASLLDLEHALEKMQRIDPRLVQAAELRIFGGLSVREMAPLLGLSLTRAKVVWLSTKAMLARLLDGPVDDAGAGSA